MFLNSIKQAICIYYYDDKLVSVIGLSVKMTHNKNVYGNAAARLFSPALLLITMQLLPRGYDDSAPLSKPVKYIALVTSYSQYVNVFKVILGQRVQLYREPNQLH